MIAFLALIVDRLQQPRGRQLDAANEGCRDRWIELQRLGSVRLLVWVEVPEE